MEYLVHTSGKVTKFHNKAYVVKASSEGEAQEIAKQNFENEFECVRVDAVAQSYVRGKRAVIACVLMLIAVFISLFTYKYEDTVFLIFKKTKEFTIAPNIYSILLAIVFYVIYVIRFKGIKRTIGTYIDVAFCVLSVLLLSSVFSLILSAEDIKILGFIPTKINSYHFLVIAILASLLGVKLLSAASMSFIAILAVSNLSAANKAMELWGVVYIMCAFLGILFYLSVEPALVEALPEIKNSISATFGSVKKDFCGAKEEAKSIANKIAK